MSRDKERLDAAATRDVPWTSDSESDAARALVGLFPSLPASRAWLLYDSLRRAVLRAPGPTHASLRRVLAAQIPGVVARVLESPVAGAYVGSLLAMLIDPTPAFVPSGFPGVPCPPISVDGRTAAMVPSNSSGSSCFCDVVLVAMFLATRGYDEVLSRDPFARAWRDSLVYDDALVGLGWLKKLREDVKTSPCFSRHLERGETESSAVANTERDGRKTQTLLRERIVRPMRTRVSVSALGTAGNILGDVVSELRSALLECGFMGELFQQEDSEELFEAILRVGEWRALFLPIVRRTREITFRGTVGGHDLAKAVPPRTVVEMDPVHVILQFPPDPRREGEPLQGLLTSTYFLPEESWEELNRSYLEYIREAAPKLRKVDDEGFLSVDASARIVTRERLLKVPDPFAFSLRRVTHERGSPERNNIKALLPGDGVLEIPSPERGLRYRIFAIACQTGGDQSGHYFLYFRCSGSRDADSWYYYNDRGPELKRVDVRDPWEENFISQNAYLFWAERIS